MKKVALKKKSRFPLEIDLAHIGYKVMVVVAPKEFTGYYANSVMITESTTRHSSTIFLRNKSGVSDHGTIAHEIIHVLQNICRYRNMIFEKESEHMAYLMQYIYGQILGLKWDI